MLTKFIQNAFSGLFEIFMWLGLLGIVIAAFAQIKNGFLVFLGILIGGFIGFVVLFGIVATLLDMAKHIKSIDEKTR